MNDIFLLQLLEVLSHETHDFRMEEADALPHLDYVIFDTGSTNAAQYGYSTVRARVIQGDIRNITRLEAVASDIDSLYVREVRQAGNSGVELTLDSRSVYSNGYVESIQYVLTPGMYFLSLESCGASAWQEPDQQRQLLELLLDYSDLQQKDYLKSLIRPGYFLWPTDAAPHAPVVSPIDFRFRQNEGIEGVIRLLGEDSSLRFMHFRIPENVTQWPLLNAVTLHDSEPVRESGPPFQRSTFIPVPVMQIPSVAHSLLEIKADEVDIEVYEDVRERYYALLNQYVFADRMNDPDIRMGGYPAELQDCLGVDHERMLKPYPDIRPEDASMWKFAMQISEALFYEPTAGQVVPDGKFYFSYHPSAPGSLLINYQNS